MKRRNRRGLPAILAGLLLLAAAGILTGYNMRDESRAEEASHQMLVSIERELPAPQERTMAPTQPEAVTLRQMGPAEVAVPDWVLNPDMALPAKEVDGLLCAGILSVPSLELELPVLAQWSYPGLKQAPCLYTGSPYQDNLVLAAHNYPSHFGRINTLYPGDEVRFTDMDGNVFVYEVDVLETLQPTAVQKMTEADNWDLTLFTCTLGGRSRVTVRCSRVEV